MNHNTINVRGRLIDLSTPKVMGILNATPDSFYSGSRKQTEREIADRANQIMDEGGTFIDVGAFSTRPGAVEVSEEEETERLKRAIAIVRREQPDAPISVDTYRPLVARRCIEEFGADIINDVSEGGITGIVDTPIHEQGNMFKTVGELKVITAQRDGMDAAAMRKQGDFLRDKEPGVEGVLASVNEGKVTLLAVCGKDAVAKGVKAGDIIKAIAPICGGKGGGKPDSAMGGGTEVSKVDDALAAVDDFVAGKL